MGTQKKLIVLRHAKSSWDEPEKDDFDRVLKVKGIEDIKLLAKTVKGLATEIDAVFTSPANRAVHTSILFALALGIGTSKIQIVENLYGINVDELLSFVKSSSDSLDTIVVVGHNPTLTDFVNLFFKESIPNLPTAGIAQLIFDSGEWKCISRKNLKSNLIDFPKNHQ